MNLKSVSLKKFNKKTLLLIFFITCASVLKLVNLGYSDYQGDETKAFYITKGQNFSQFLLSQRKAPGQFILTMFLKPISGNYTSEFITRLPFAIFSIISCYVFFLIVKKLINQKVAFYSLIFFATNGLFVALSRIVQYQSLVIFLMFLVIYQLLLLSENGNIKHLYIAGILWGLSFLTHSDSIYFFPICFFLLIEWVRKNNLNLISTIRKTILPIFLGISIMSVFYLPYLLNLPAGALNYWKARVEGTHQPNVVNSSRYTFEVYQPIYVSHLYILAFLAGLVILLIRKKTISWERKLGIVSWFLFSYIFMEYAVEVPGTHIYTYIIPVIIVMGYFFNYISDFLSKKFKKLLPAFYLGVFLIFSFLFLQSYAIFVSHEREYPWQEESFLVWKFPILNPTFKLTLFGFPYSRNWEDISKFIIEDGRSVYYATNEKPSLPRYYLPNNYVNDTGMAGYYIFINDPLSMTKYVINKRCASWVDTNDPIKIYYNKEGEVVAKLYYIPETY